MATFIIRRLLWLVVVLFAISILVFLIFFATPGVDPARQMAGRNPTAETIKNIKHEFGLDRPLPVQYGLMMKHIFVSRDLISYGSHTKVIPEILSAAPVTLSLVFGAAVIWIVFSILTGLAAAVFRGTVIDPLLMILALIGISIPVFWLGEVVNLVTQSRLHGFFLFSWVPPLGYTPFTQDPLLWFEGLVFPWLTLSVLYIGFYARVLRANLIETENEDYVRTARAKGIAPRTVDRRHILRNALLPVTTVIGLQTGLLLSGAILTETVFDWPGVGTWLSEAIFNRDYPVLQGGILFLAVVFVLVNLVVDLTYGLINPRIRYS